MQVQQPLVDSPSLIATPQQLLDCTHSKAHDGKKDWKGGGGGGIKVEQFCLSILAGQCTWLYVVEACLQAVDSRCLAPAVFPLLGVLGDGGVKCRG